MVTIEGQGSGVGNRPPDEQPGGTLRPPQSCAIPGPHALDAQGRRDGRPAAGAAATEPRLLILQVPPRLAQAGIPESVGWRDAAVLREALGDPAVAVETDMCPRMTKALRDVRAARHGGLLK